MLNDHFLRSNHFSYSYRRITGKFMVTNQTGLWFWSSNEDTHIIHMSSVIPIRPNLEVNFANSSSRYVMMDLVNSDLIENYTDNL